MVLLAIWVLIVSPLLCLAGSLVHPCADDCIGPGASAASGWDSGSCDPACVHLEGADRSSADGCAADFCSHEDECVGDPCADSIVRPDAGPDPEVWASLSLSEVPTTPKHGFRSVRHLAPPTSPPRSRFSPKRIPVPVSDLPLRN